MKKQTINFLESLVGKRFNEETLSKAVSDFFKEEIKVSYRAETEYDELPHDWNIVFNSEKPETYGYFDVYVLNMRTKGFDGSTFYVTEVAYEFDGLESCKDEIESIETKPKNTYYLFGEDAVKEFETNGIDALIELSEKQKLSYGTFLFKEGVTLSHELADAMDGWNNFTIITEDEFNKL